MSLTLPRGTEVITPPDGVDWGCGACAAALLAGTTYEDFVASCGHDGSEVVAWSRHGDCRRGFTILDVLRFLLQHDIVCGPAPRLDVPCPGGCFSFKLPVDRTQAAMVTVDSGSVGVTHWVVYAGNDQVFDSNFPGQIRSLNQYRIMEWWPCWYTEEHASLVDMVDGASKLVDTAETLGLE